MKIYTKTGDTGQTGLYGSARVPKDHLRIEAIGAVDELNAALGWARTQVDDPNLAEVLVRLQNECFVLGADLAAPRAERDTPTTLRISASETAALEAEIDRFDDELPALRSFILPGGSRGAAALHVARGVCRRTERRVVSLASFEEIGPEVARYLNRLSDHLFVLARLSNKRAGRQDVIWSRNSMG